jgi:hypothetical protein
MLSSAATKKLAWLAGYKGNPTEVKARAKVSTVT